MPAPDELKGVLGTPVPPSPLRNITSQLPIKATSTHESRPSPRPPRQQYTSLHRQPHHPHVHIPTHMHAMQSNAYANAACNPSELAFAPFFSPTTLHHQLIEALPPHKRADSQPSQEGGATQRELKVPRTSMVAKRSAGAPAAGGEGHVAISSFVPTA